MGGTVKSRRARFCPPINLEHKRAHPCQCSWLQYPEARLQSKSLATSHNRTNMSVFNVELRSRHAALQWYRVWTLPVYAGMYLVHSRYRALRPRRLPTLTSLRLPEIYGLLALGDIAGYEAEHLRDDELDGNRRSIESCSELLHMLFHERRYEVEAGYPDLTRSK